MTPSSRLGHLLWLHVELSVRRPWAIVAGCLLLGAVAAALAARLEFKGDFVELLPARSPEVQDLRFVEERAGGGGYLVVQVKGATREQRRAFGAAYARRLEREPELVRYVESRFDFEFFKERALLMLTTAKLEALHAELKARVLWEKKLANPLYVDLGEETPPLDFEALKKKYAADAPQGEWVESQDGRELYLYVKPAQLAGDLDFNRRLVGRARAVAAEVGAGFPGVAADFTGAYVIRVEEDEVMQADLARAASLAAVIALGVILLASRRPSALVIVAAPVALGIAATFAFAWALVGHLNPVTGFLGAILIGLGIEYGVHLSMRYWEEREEADVKDALERAVLGTFSGALTSAATNAAAFFVLVFAEFEAFKQFGKIAAFGVLATVVAAYAMGPAVLVIAERWRPFRRKGKAPLTLPAADVSPRAGRGSLRPALVGVLGTVAAFAAYSVWVSPRVGFETDLKRLKGESPATALDDHVNEQLGLIMAPALLHVGSLEQALAAQRVVEAVGRERGERTAFARVASLNDLIPYDADARLAVVARLRELVEELPNAVKEGEQKAQVDRFLALTDAKPWGPEEVPLEIRRRFTPLEGGGTLVLIFPRYSGYDVGELELWAGDLSEVGRRLRALGIESYTLDGNRIAARIFVLIRQDGPLVLGLAALVVFSMIWFSLKSLRGAALVALPLYLGMACIFGAMHAFDVRLNFLNVVVLPNLLAIAVDNSVHLFHRYKQEGPGSLGHVLRHTGYAAVVATVSNAAGYGAMLVARHEGLRSVGVMALLGVACTFVGTTVFFPALLALLEKRPSPALAPRLP